WVRALLICLLGVSREGVTEGSERWEPIGTGRASGEDDVLVAHLPGQIWLLKLARHLARGGSAREDMNVLEARTTHHRENGRCRYGLPRLPAGRERHDDESGR